MVKIKTVIELVNARLKFDAAFIADIENDMKIIHKALHSKSLFSKEVDNAFELIEHHALYGLKSRVDFYDIDVVSTIEEANSDGIPNIKKVYIEDNKLIFELYPYFHIGDNHNWMNMLNELAGKVGSDKRIKSIGNNKIDPDMEMWIKDENGIYPVTKIEINADKIIKGEEPFITLIGPVAGVIWEDEDE